MLDTHQDIWIVQAWGSPARLVAPVFDGAHPESTVAQVDAGWDVCAFLTQTGDAFVVFPFHGSFNAEVETHLTQPGGEQREILREGNQVPCQCWNIQHHPTKLPALPNNLPALGTNAVDAPPKLIKIAAGDGFVVGLTDGGHVLKLDLRTNDESALREMVSNDRLQWDYVSMCARTPSSADRSSVRSFPDFAMRPTSATSRVSDPNLQRPRHWKI